MGVDRFLIVDNGIHDGTGAVLGAWRAIGRSAGRSVSGPARQSQLLTELAREAYLGGADWVLPIDVDEFWWGDTGNLRSELQGSPAGRTSRRGHQLRPAAKSKWICCRRPPPYEQASAV